MKESSSNFSRDWIGFSIFISRSIWCFQDEYIFFSSCIRDLMTLGKDDDFAFRFRDDTDAGIEAGALTSGLGWSLSLLESERERERETCACTKSAGLNYTFDKISARAHKACTWSSAQPHAGGSFVRSRANVFFRNSRIWERAPIASLCMRICIHTRACGPLTPLPRQNARPFVFQRPPLCFQTRITDWQVKLRAISYNRQVK